MAEHSDRSVLFENLFHKPLLARFDGELHTSNAGLPLLAGIDRRLGLTAALARRITDRRDPSRVAHGVEDLLRQRVYSIALGYPDTNDAAQLASDPALLLACGRRADDTGGLASQPTLSRFEHAVAKVVS